MTKYNYYQEAPTHTRHVAGTMTVRLENSVAMGPYVTKVLLQYNIAGDWANLHMERFTNLVHLMIVGSTQVPVLLTGDITDYVMPATLETFQIENTHLITGDLTAWVMPAGMKTFDIRHDVLLSGDITEWELPAGLEWFDIHDTHLSGDISHFALPATLKYLWCWSMLAGSLTGDISGWTLPAGFLELRASGNGSMTGDLSGWSLPSSMTYLTLAQCGTTGSTSGWTLPAGMAYFDVSATTMTGTPALAAGTHAMDYYNVQNCGLSQANVDAIISSIYARRANFGSTSPELLIGGTNAAPSGTYQASATPTTGKEMIYALANDPNAEGFKKWSITYTA